MGRVGTAFEGDLQPGEMVPGEGLIPGPVQPFCRLDHLANGQLFVEQVILCDKS